MTRRTLRLPLIALSVALAAAATLVRAQYPKPSPFPIAWELTFEHGEPRRVIVPGPNGVPEAYWYMTYSVTNNTEREQVFLPRFEMLTRPRFLAIRHGISQVKNHSIRLVSPGSGNLRLITGRNQEMRASNKGLHGFFLL